MRIINKTIGSALAVALAFGIAAGTASAQEELKLNQVGAALALPLLGSFQTFQITYLTVTNVGPSDRNLHFNAISGNGWKTTDFDCAVTASETLLISFAPSQVPGFYTIAMECNFGTGAPIFVSRQLAWDEGILFIANETHQCGPAANCTTNANDLFGDFVVVNLPQGLAYSSGAVPFQGKNPLAPGLSDREYLFDNDEYAMFPATLASNFIAPGFNPTLAGFLTAELVLFVLDGRALVGSQAALDIVFYDDDENPTSAHHTFDCFDIVPLTEIDPNFEAQFLGSDAGHLYMTTIDMDQRSNVHDNKFGNGNRIRVVGVHGWIVQSMAFINFGGEQGPVLTGQFGGWSRTLAQGMMPQDLDGSDTPAYDGL